MIECPFCGQQVALDGAVCPSCRHEVRMEHLASAGDDSFPETAPAHAETDISEESSLEEAIHARFRCAKCGHHACSVKEVAMTGAGLSKLFDIQHRHYLFVTCLHCGVVEVYDPDVLRGHKSGRLGTVLDVLFGG